MSLMDIFAGFSGRKAEPVPVAVDPSKLNPTVPGDATLKSTGSVAAIPKAGEGDASPLANYGDLWQPNDPTKVKAPASTEVSIPADPAKMLAAAKTIDFTKAIDPALLEKALKGDSAALLQAMNSVSQATYAQAAGVTAKIVENALNAQSKVFNNEILPAALKKAAVADSLRTENPIFNDPAVSPMLSIVENQLQMKHPGASAAEITAKAKEYLLGVSETIMGTSADKQVTAKPVASSKNPMVREEQDWSKFLDVA